MFFERGSKDKIMKRLLIGLLAFTSISSFAQDGRFQNVFSEADAEFSHVQIKKSGRFAKTFALLDLVSACVYGQEVDCKAAIGTSLRLRSTSEEIINAIKDEVEKAKYIDKQPVETTKNRLRKLFKEADEAFNAEFSEFMNAINNLES